MQAHKKSFSSHGSDGYTVPNKSFLQSDPKDFSNFHGGFRHGGCFSNHSGGWSGGTNGDEWGCGRFANFQCQVCLNYGHVASVCNYRYDQHYQPNLTLMLHNPTCHNYAS